MPAVSRFAAAQLGLPEAVSSTAPGLTHDVLSRVDVSWLALWLALGTAVFMMIVRRLRGTEHRTAGGGAVVFMLLASFVVRLGMWPLEWLGYEQAASALRFASAVLLTAGMAGAIGVLLFEIILERLGVRIPTILRGILMMLGFVVAMFALMRLRGADLVSLVTTSAVLTAVIGLALQEPIANMFSGLAVQIDQTLRPGDWIGIGDREGRIQRVSFRSTTLLTRDGNLVYLPNRQLVQSQVVNFTRPYPHRRVVVELGFHLRHSPSEVRDVLLEAIAGVPGVLTEPAPEVVLGSFEDSAMHYQLYFWLKDFERAPQIEGAVRSRIWYAARRARLEVPFPTRTVLMHQAGELEARHEGDDRKQALRKVEILSVLDDDDLTRLAERLDRHEYARGETLIAQGEAGDSLYLIASGEVAVTLAGEHGAQVRLATLGAGDFVGEASLMTGEPRSATCVAETDVVCHVVTHAVLEELLRKKPELAERLSQVLSTRQTALEAERDGLSAEAARARRAETGGVLLSKIRAFFGLR
jgi:small-conductance mechanosensitive channel